MGAKRFGAILVQPNVSTIVMTGQPGKDNVIVVNIANQGTGTTNISVAYMSGNVTANLNNSEYLIFNYALNQSEFLQLKGIAVEEGYSIVVKTSTHPVSVVTYGMSNPVIQ